MKRKILSAILAVCCATAWGMAQKPTPAQKPTVYIVSHGDGFATALTAGFFKKKLPVTVVTKPAGATYEIKYSLTDQKGKPIAQALAFGLGGVGGFFIGRGSMTASVIVSRSGAVVYAYTVHKKGAGAIQKAAESFAKNWKKRLAKAK